MASIQKRVHPKTKKKTFYAQVRKKGHASVSKIFLSQAEAHAWAEEIEHRLENGTEVLKGKTFNDACDRFRLEVSPTRKGWRWEDVRLKKFERYNFANSQLAHLTVSDFQAWVDTSSLSSGSVRREVSLIGAVLSKCRKWRWIAHDPLKGLEMPKAPPPRRRKVTDGEITQVLNALAFDPKAEHRGLAWEMAVAFQLAVETGMRHGEMWSLDWQDVHLERRFCRLHDSKNSDGRDVALSKKAVALLETIGEQNKGRVFKTNSHSAQSIFYRKMRAAGIKNLHFHDSRAEGISRLADKLDVLQLARQIGHRDPKSLMFYYNKTGEEIAALLD